MGGDGAMYDIGFQALSRMVASGADIKVLVLDTQVYSNTGGQASTASFGGQVTKLSAFGAAIHGRPEARKELGRILMAHGDVYVAQTTPAHVNHFYRSIIEANEFPGPAVVIVYSACMPEHGIADDAASRPGATGRRLARIPAVHVRPTARCADERAPLPPGQSGRARGLVADADGRAGRLPGLRPDRRALRPAFRDPDGRPTPEIIETQRDRLDGVADAPGAGGDRDPGRLTPTSL